MIRLLMVEHVPEPSDLPERARVVHQHLRAANLPAQIHELPDSTRTAREAANALGCEVGAIASSLVFLADGKPLLVMTSGRHRVDTTLLASSLGVSTVEMAPAQRVRDVTGQAIGGVAPVGHPTPLRTMIDESLSDYDTIWAAGGTPHTIFALTYDELINLTHGTPIVVAKE
jgi:prolyl-tRNA editing enzyme YbaK/EbsC (Cys-tRNA(Pro) deacylase)